MTKPMIIQAYQGEKTETPCVWLMRQAGRYLPEYRALREKAGSFLKLCYTPDWGTEVTLQPMRRYELDAAILFSDILVVPHAMGQDLDFKTGEGPVLGDLDLSRLSVSCDAIDAHCAPIYETVRQVRAELEDHRALIGFCGAPWTVACYMVDGKGKTGFPKAREMAENAPEEMDRIIQALVTASLYYLRAQIEAGAQAIQIFDSWAGYLEGAAFERFCVKPVKALVDGLRAGHPDIPVIGFPRRMTGDMGAYTDRTGIDCLALGTQADLQQARRLDCCLQGNLDPELLLQGGAEMRKAAKDIIRTLETGPYVFNLGHGVIKETPPDHVRELVEVIKGC